MSFRESLSSFEVKNRQGLVNDVLDSNLISVVESEYYIIKF